MINARVLRGAKTSTEVEDRHIADQQGRSGRNVSHAKFVVPEELHKFEETASRGQLRRGMGEALINPPCAILARK